MMETKRVTRSTTVEENAPWAGKGEANASRGIKRSTLGETTNHVKGAFKSRGLAVRNAGNATVDIPAAPPAKRRAETKENERVQEVERRVERVCEVKRAKISEECDLLTEDYVEDIKNVWLSMEDQYAIDELFMTDKKVTHKQRSILVDWLIQVHQRFHLLPETLHLTVYLVDRCLERLVVDKTELQLVGISAMLTASKYEETYCPELKDFEFITDNAFTKKQMLRMEQRVLHACTLDLGRPLSIQFLRSYQKGECDPVVHNLAKYFTEMALMDFSFSPIRPSIIAASSLWLAAQIRSPKMSYARQFAAIPVENVMEEIKRVGRELAASVLRIRIVGKLKAVTEKYNSSKLSHASALSDAEIKQLEKLAS